MVAHHWGIGQQVIDMAGIRVDLVVLDGLRGRVGVVLVLLPVAHELVVVLDVAVQVEVVLRLLVVVEIAVHPGGSSGRGVRVIPHLRHLAPRDASSHVGYLRMASHSHANLDGDVVVAVRDDHVDGLGVCLAQRLHVLHRRPHGVLHDLEDHVMDVRGDVVEGTREKRVPASYRNLFAKNTFTEGAFP